VTCVGDVRDLAIVTRGTVDALLKLTGIEFAAG